MQKILTGCGAIDDLLKGGLPVEAISLIYGEPETGKTTLAIQCSANCAGSGFKTLFVDADGTFSVRRLSQIAQAHFKEISEMIVLTRPNDFREQTTIVEQLTDYISSRFKLVVFDTITSLYRLRIAESPSKTFELNRELNRQLALLAQVAKTQKIAVLVTSQVHAVLNEAPVSIEPVATRVLKFWADTILALKPTANPQVVQATVEKNQVKLPQTTVDLKIYQTGLHDYTGHR